MSKDGEGLKKVWQKHFQQLRNVSAEMAAAITNVYPSPQSLIKVLHLVVLPFFMTFFCKCCHLAYIKCFRTLTVVDLVNLLNFLVAIDIIFYHVRNSES